MLPDEPAPRLRRAFRLKTLRERRTRWAAVRAARKALFSRPTPVAARLQFVARLHKFVDYLYFAVCLLLGMRIAAQLFAFRDLTVAFDFYTLLELPLLSWLQAMVPPVALGPERQLDLPALILLLMVSLIVRAIHALIHVLTPRLLKGIRETRQPAG